MDAPCHYIKQGSNAKLAKKDIKDSMTRDYYDKGLGS